VLLKYRADIIDFLIKPKYAGQVMGKITRNVCNSSIFPKTPNQKMNKSNLQVHSVAIVTQMRDNNSKMSKKLQHMVSYE
jgi:hypothetical protein